MKEAINCSPTQAGKTRTDYAKLLPVLILVRGTSLKLALNKRTTRSSQKHRYCAATGQSVACSIKILFLLLLLLLLLLLRDGARRANVSSIVGGFHLSWQPTPACAGGNLPVSTRDEDARYEQHYEHYHKPLYRPYVYPLLRA